MAAQPKASSQASDPVRELERFDSLVAELYLEIMATLPPAKVTEVTAAWFRRTEIEEAEALPVAVLAEAVVRGGDLAMFTPSMSGTTHVDRFARQWKAPGHFEAAALEALRKATFRLVRLRARESGHRCRAEDVATGETLTLFMDVPEAALGLTAGARLYPLAPGLHGLLGGIVLLDPAALAVAMGFVRPGKALNGQRCAAAVYRHVVRHGTIRIPGLNELPEAGNDNDNDDDDVDDDADQHPIQAIAAAWADLADGEAPDAESVSAVRTNASTESVVVLIILATRARKSGAARLADAYARMALLQMETLHLRGQARFGNGASALDEIAAGLQSAIGRGQCTAECRFLFEDLRRRLAAAQSPHSRSDDELARVLQRIRSLRAKTMDQGCTEQEALAAAAKVAELLDRYGLTLSEIDLRQQACEGVSIETARRRLDTLDECVPTIAAFCDCRAWIEKTTSGALRHVFFGMPADVAAARYLYDLVAAAFETETEQFKRGRLYREGRGPERSEATRSFRRGLAKGICGKLQSLKQAREAALKTSSGRDLVVLKTSVIEEELEKLGLSFKIENGGRTRRVRLDAYQAGEVAGRQFEVNAEIGRE